MKLTPELKAEIDSESYAMLLTRWRFAEIGDPIFQGESGRYITERMHEYRSRPGGEDMHTAASKSIGWD